MMAATAVSAASQVFSGYVQNRQGRYEAQVARNNAAMEREAAADAQDRGRQAELKKWREIAAVRSEQVAAMAANGLDTSTGTAADIQDDTLSLGYQDVQTINENTQRETRGHIINASNYMGQASAARARGRNAMVGSLFAAGGTILSGAGQVAGMGSGAPVGKTTGAALNGPTYAKITPYSARKINTAFNNPFQGLTVG